MGVPLGSLVGMGLGGIVADAWGWRMAFVVCGLPGLALAAVVAFTLVEPRVKSAIAVTRKSMATTFGETLRALSLKRTFWLVAFAAAVKAFIGYGHAPFTASFFYRNHAEEIAESAAFFGLQSGGFLGLALGLVGGVGGALGAYVGGQIADRFGARDLRAYVSVPGIAALITIPIYVTAINLPEAKTAIGLLTLNAILATLWYGPVYATAQSIVPPHMRATAAAILLFIINLVGLGLGPLAVGAISDVFAIQFGLGKAEGIRWALMASALFGVLAAALFWLARSTIREEMEG
jgi:MFS family permease